MYDPTIIFWFVHRWSFLYQKKAHIFSLSYYNLMSCKEMLFVKVTSENVMNYFEACLKGPVRWPIHPRPWVQLRESTVSSCQGWNAVFVMGVVMEVSRPVFTGLGLIAVSSLKGLGLKVQRSRSRLRLLYRDHKSWRRKKWKWKYEKSTRSAVVSNITSENMMFFVL